MSDLSKEFGIAYELFNQMERLDQACIALQTVHEALLEEGSSQAAVVGMVVDELIRIEENITKQIDVVDPGTRDALETSRDGISGERSNAH